MSEKIILKDHKAYYEGWDSADKKNIREHVDSESFFRYLWLPVTVEGNFQVKDIFDFLAVHHSRKIPGMDETLLQLILGEHYVDDLLDEYCMYTHGKRVKTEMKYSQIVVSYNGETELFDNVKIDFKKDETSKGQFKKVVFGYTVPKKIITHREMNIYFDVSGRVRGKKEFYAVEFAPFCAYADAQLVLDDDFQIWDTDYTHAARNKKNKKFFENKKSYGKAVVTVLDLLKALIYEFTFCGSPADRDGKSEDIQKRVKECKEGLKSGKIKLEK